MLLNTAKCQGYSFYCLQVIKGKPTAGRGQEGVRLPPLPTQVRVKTNKVSHREKCTNVLDAFKNHSSV